MKCSEALCRPLPLKRHPAKRVEWWGLSCSSCSSCTWRGQDVGATTSRMWSSAPTRLLSSTHRSPSQPPSRTRATQTDPSSFPSVSYMWFLRSLRLFVLRLRDAHAKTQGFTITQGNFPPKTQGIGGFPPHFRQNSRYQRFLRLPERVEEQKYIVDNLY